MSVLMTILTCVLTSGTLTALVQYFIDRADKKNDKLQVIADKIDELSKRMDKTEADRLEDKALSYRGHIIRFNEECLRGERHSHEAFKDVMRAMTSYDSYCSENPQFKNHECDASEKNIQRVYEKCMADGDFLSH